MQRDDVGGAQQAGQRSRVLDPQLGAARRREAAAPADHLHPEGAPDLGDQGADLAEPDHAQRRTVQAPAQAGLPCAAAKRIDLPRQIAHQRENQRRR